MTRDRIVQMISAVVVIVATTASGMMLPSLIDQSEEYELRYTSVAVEGAPAIVALGQSIGVLRGLIVDFLWIKVHMMKEKGLFYEVMADSELITKLQPRFASVWGFHGHNMAYNISVATHTEQERWQWVKAGIDLVREEGIRYNPNDLELHKELAFWFAHKIEGYADDAHLYYKTQFTKEWHYLLGEPPIAWEDRVEWMKTVADAPDTLAEAERRAPGIRVLVNRLQEDVSPYFADRDFGLDFRLLQAYGDWKAITQQSALAQSLGAADEIRSRSPMFRAFDDIVAPIESSETWQTLLAHVRKRVLIDDYNMDPQLMYEFTRDVGPIDWRHGQAHALYWSRRGSLAGDKRALNDDDIYKVVNNDRLQLQAMQSLARNGRITFDPLLTSELPSRLPEPLWIDAIYDQFEYFWIKHEETRGWGGDTFIGFLENFMSSAIREWYRSGELEKATELMARMDKLFGRGARIPNNKYAMPLDVFVEEETRGEYLSNPAVAPSEVIAGLRYGIRVGIGQDRPEVYRESVKFARKVTDLFRSSEMYGYTNKFGRGRLMELVSRLERSVEDAFLQVIIDPTLSLEERATIWRNVDRMEPQLRARVYDKVVGQLQLQLSRSIYGNQYRVADLFPAPPNLEEVRQMIAAERARIQQQLDEQRERENIAPQQ